MALLTNSTFLAYAQSNEAETLLTSTKDRRRYYVQTRPENAIVFGVRGNFDVPAHVFYVDTLLAQPSSSNYSYASTRSRLRLTDNTVLLVANKRDDKPTRISLEAASNVRAAYQDVNEGIWWDCFMKMIHEIDSAFEWYRYGFHAGFSRWNALRNKELAPHQFKVEADSIVAAIKDSIFLVQTQKTIRIKNLIDSLTVLDYSSARARFILLSKEAFNPGERYFDGAVNGLALRRPDFFFALWKDEPLLRKRLRNVAYERDAITALKQSDHNVPAKKSFFRQRTKDGVLFVLSITGIIIWEVAVVGGLIYLISN